jgi:hypothetical protein
MAVRLPTYAAILLGLAVLLVPACNRGTVAVTSPATTTDLKVSVAAEPSQLKPEIFPNPCPTHPSFGVRLTVIVGGDDLIVRDVRFGFVDRRGARFTPDVFAATEGVASIPTSSPIPFGSISIPNASPVPIPNAPPITGILLRDSRRLTLPFFLRFGCGVLSEGSVIVSVDTADTLGRSGVHEVGVPVQ